MQYPAFDLVVATVAFLTVGLSIYNRATARARNLKLPPGPKGLPVLGNIHQLPKAKWNLFLKWKALYGPIFRINILGQNIVVLNTAKAVTDLLERRSRIYSDRPRFVMSGEILSGNVVLAFLTNGSLWRRSRRVMHATFGPIGADMFRKVQEAEAAHLMIDFVNSPTDWHANVQLSVYSMMLRVIYGVNHIGSHDDPLLVFLIAVTSKHLSNAPPGSHISDVLPFLNKFPSWIARWKKWGQTLHNEANAIIIKIYRDAKKKLDLTPTPSFCKTINEMQKSTNLTEKEAAWLAATAFGAGSDTTGSSLQVFILAMALYPDVMMKARGIIDSVCSRTRPPTLDDKKYLPYILALIKEVLRWRIIDPLTVPHCASEDDSYMGYDIPKGTITLANVWAISRDPDVYSEPDEFRPERYLNENTMEEVDYPDCKDGIHTFGHGRRVCPGVALGNNSLFITVAMFLWALEIDVIETPDRNAFDDEGLIARPPNFKCGFRYRDEAAAKTLARLAI
ncbi:cytochrome P450 [Ramaria rubella]|nr:cytochrome P450 [Ramaria rubella]